MARRSTPCSAGAPSESLWLWPTGSMFLLIAIFIVHYSHETPQISARCSTLPFVDDTPDSSSAWELETTEGYKELRLVPLV